ncbi:MAG: ATP-binding protein [Chlamydiales bacterium]
MSKNQISRTLSLFTEATDRLKLAHNRLQKQFDKLQHKLDLFEQISQHMSDGLLFVSTQGVITLFNSTAALFTGLPQKNVIGSSFWDCFPDLFFGFSLSQALSHPSKNQRVILTLDDADTSREIEVCTSSIPKRGILLLLRDRVELKQLEQALQQSDRLKELGEMAATLAHEIRNPLGGIEGYASLLKQDLTEPDHQHKIQAIIKGTRTLNQLVTDVLDYARPLKLHFAPVNLADLIRDTIDFVSTNAKACPIKFNSEMNQFCVAGDRERLKLVLLNVFQNAFETSTQKVEVALKEEGCISIADQGEGIESHNLDKIFSPFFTTKVYGTGLGLAEADKVIRAHGGSISVESKKGKGTTITINFQNCRG